METQRPGPTGETVDTPAHRALSSASRVAILRLVRAAEDGMTTGEVATTTGLHLSTARAHLDRLAGAGLLVRQRGGGGVPGRPAWRYHAAAPDPAPAPYRALAAALLQHLADTDFDVWQTAVRAGEGWGIELAAAEPDAAPIDAVMRVLDSLGFEPQRWDGVTVATDGPAGLTPASGPTALAAPGTPRPLRLPPARTAPHGASGEPGGPDGAGGLATEVHLRTCPFLELVADHPETMCGLHLGVVRGVLARSGAPDTRTALLPFGAPDACVLRLMEPAESRP